jgi:hypothetical protein
VPHLRKQYLHTRSHCHENLKSHTIAFRLNNSTYTEQVTHFSEIWFQHLKPNIFYEFTNVKKKLAEYKQFFFLHYAPHYFHIMFKWDHSVL